MGVATGTLVDKFNSWYDKFVLLAGIIGDVFAGLWGILRLAGETGTPFFDKIAEAAQKFRDWVGSAEGQNKIKDFFDKIQPVLDEVWRLIGNVFDLIINPAAGDGGAVMLATLATAFDSVNGVLEDPLTAKIVPYLLASLLLSVVLSFMGKVFGTAIGGLTTSSAIRTGSARSPSATSAQASSGSAQPAMARSVPRRLDCRCAACGRCCCRHRRRRVDLLGCRSSPVLDLGMGMVHQARTPMKIFVGTLAALRLPAHRPVGSASHGARHRRHLQAFEAVKDWVGDAWDAVWTSSPGSPDHP